MVDLPSDRTIDEPPFTNFGVDMFGPFLIKEGRKELKRYGALFTCLSSGKPILNAPVVWRQILSYKLCVVLLHKEETLLECYVVTMVLILWEHKRNWKSTRKWIIRRLNSSFRTLVQITLIGAGTSQHRAIWGVFGKDKFGWHIQY